MREDIDQFDDGYTAYVERHGVAMLRLTRGRRVVKH